MLRHSHLPDYLWMGRLIWHVARRISEQSGNSQILLDIWTRVAQISLSIHPSQKIESLIIFWVVIPLLLLGSDYSINYHLLFKPFVATSQRAFRPDNFCHLSPINKRTHRHQAHSYAWLNQSIVLVRHVCKFHVSRSYESNGILLKKKWRWKLNRFQKKKQGLCFRKQDDPFNYSCRCYAYIFFICICKTEFTQLVESLSTDFYPSKKPQRTTFIESIPEVNIQHYAISS